MSETNAVFQLLKGLTTEQAELPIYYRGRYYNLNAPDFPVLGVIKFVQDQLNTLKKELKEAENAAQADGS